MKLNLTLTKLVSLLALVPSAYVIADESTSRNRDNKPSLRGNFGKLAQDIERKLADPSTPCNTIIEVQSLATIKATLENIFAAQSTEYFDESLLKRAVNELTTRSKISMAAGCSVLEEL